MKFTVVIPLYNKEHYIKNALQSVLQQSYQDFEVIVIDDGSTDQSLRVVERIISEKVTIIKQNNQGVSVARNTGIENAKGEYIAFLDADDYWHKDYLLTINELIDGFPKSDIFVTAYEVDMGDGRINKSSQLKPEKGCLDSYWKTLTEKYDFVWTSAVTIRRESLIQAGLFRVGEKIGQDLDMWARVARINPKVAYSSKICVRYNRAAESNARTRVKIARAKAFLRDLEEELANPRRTKEEYIAIQKKYDKKMTVYIFTSILAGEKKRAKKALNSWKGKKNLRNRFLRIGLKLASLMPGRVNRWIYSIRLKLF